MDLKHIQTKYLKPALWAFAGLLIGWFLFHGSDTTDETTVKETVDTPTAAPGKKIIWVSAMHPYIRRDKPGKCPICGMDLVPMEEDAEGNLIDPNALVMTEEAMRLADVETFTVQTGLASKRLRLYGKVQVDERAKQTLSAHIPGRIERLDLNYTGETVRKGQVIGTVYSPDLVTAQNELLEALQMGENGRPLVDAARNKLKQWKLTDAQIRGIEQSGEAVVHFPIVSTITGVVLAKQVNEGDYVAQGTALYAISDLRKLWVLFDAYERDLPWIRQGDRIAFTAEAVPGKTFSGVVSFIDPVIDPLTRTAKVRVEYTNDGRFKPEMFVTGLLESKPPKTDQLVVPNSAVLWTGERSIVYVKDPTADRPTFHLREVVLGASLGDSWIVENGLNAGEELVLRGAFEIDASAQLAGKSSMMTHQAQARPVSMPGDGASSMKMTPDMKMGAAENAGPEMRNIRVEGLCDMCKSRIEKTAKSVDGVSFAEWNKETKNLHVMFDQSETGADAIEKAIAAVGHDTEHHRAPDSVYEKLPACCQYRK